MEVKDIIKKYLKVKEIIQKYLKDNGYDGLCNDDCGCFNENLFPCFEDFSGCVPEDFSGCVPGYKKSVNGDDWIIVKKKREPIKIEHSFFIMRNK